MNSITVNEKSENINTFVSTEDNAWFVCDSRSRPGQKFYVNKVTGIKVWNITDAEIELAKKFGANCAEPAGHPAMHSQKDAQFYNKQIINSQFTNQLSNLLVNPNSSFMKADRNPPQVDLQQQIQAQQYYTLVPAAIAPLINQFAANASLQQAYQQLLHLPNNLPNVPPNNLQNAPIAQYAENQQQNYWPCNKNQRYRKNKWNRNRIMHKNNQNTQIDSHNNSDLRQKLVRKRRYSEPFAGNHEQQGYDDEDSGQNSIRSSIQIEPGLQETSTRLDLTPLKQLTASGSNTDKWYIVVDKSTILNNYNYLNNMIGSDVNCHLLIPSHVVSELKKHALENTNVQPRRILRFLSQQIESGLVKLGLDETEGQGPHKTILTCVKLALQNNNVVLISNVEEILKYKNNQHGIHIFTMEEIKDILANMPIIPRARSPTLAIKITVPNNVQKTERERKSSQFTAQINPVAVHVDTGFENKDQIRESSVNCSKTQIYPNPPKSSSACPSPVLTPDNTNTKELQLPGSVSESTETIKSPKRFKWRMKKDKTDSSKVPVASQESFETDTTKNIASMNRQTGTQNSPSKLLKTTSNFITDLPRALTASQSSLESDPTKNIASFIQTRTQSSPSKLQITTSNMSISDNDDTSEVSVVKNIPSENITVAETSTSGVSNTESSFSEKMTVPNKRNSKKVTIRDVFMFKVTYQSMNDALKTRCDEWVSRFVQIMEEILIEKLQEDPPFKNKEYPPPWNLLEAARCIIIKYSEHFNVVDAANKLSFILYKISDEHGKVPANIDPLDYMEMYSYGVYLVETLQDICSNCDDLKTASDSLKKLLYDIHNDSVDISHQDPFTDNPHEISKDKAHRDVDHNDEVDKDAPNSHPAELMGIDFCEASEIRHAENDTNPTYNLRSQKNKSEIVQNQEPQTKQKLIKLKDTETNFFDCLNLKKTIINQVDVRKETDDLDEPAITTNHNPKSPITMMSEQTNSPEKNQPKDTLDIVVHVNKNDPVTAPQTKVIRKFTRCEEFEKRLINKQLELDYEYYSDENEYANDADEEPEDDRELPVEKDVIENPPKILNGTEKDKRFLRFMGRIVRRLAEVFTRVKMQCDDYVKEVSGPQQSGIGRKMQLRENVEMACSVIGTIRDSLGGIIDRELHGKENHIQRLLEIANVEDFIPDDTLCSTYRNVITKCKNEAELLLHNVRSILKIVQA